MAIYVYDSELSKYPQLKRVQGSLVDEDVATLLDAYMGLPKQYTGGYIKDIVTDGTYYYFVVSKSLQDFDLFEYINEKRLGDSRVTCVNAKLAFSKGLSRGLGNLEETVLVDEEEDVATSYIGDSVSPTALIHNGVRVNIPEGGLVIGRSTKKADYRVDDTDVSRIHCRVYKEGNKCFVEDLGSLNGTFINGLKIKSKTELNSDSVLTLAKEEFTVM